MTGDSPDSPEQPFRRLIIGTFAGILVVLVAGVVVALVAYATKGGNDQWYQLGDDKSGKVVVQKDSGALYVLVPPSKKGGKPELRPVENFPSAQLVIGQSEPTRESVSQDAILAVSGKKIVPGPKVGIPDAPSTLPSKDNLVQKDGFRAAVCSRDSATHPVDVIFPREQRFKDTKSVGGAPVFVQTSSRRIYMVYRGKKILMTEAGMRGLDYDRLPIAVGTNWVNALPDGQGGEGPTVSGTGTAPYEMEGQQPALGQVFVNKDTKNYFVADQPKLRMISEVQARLLTANEHAKDADGRTQTFENLPSITTPTVNRLGPTPVDPGDLPASSSDPITVDNPERTTLCAWFDGSTDTTRTEITHGGQVPGANQASRSARAGQANAGKLADNTIVPAGSGAVVASLAPNGKELAYWMITSDGKKYAMPRGGEDGSDVVAILGYGEVPTRKLSNNIIGMIPTGPALTRQAAGAALVQQPPAAGQAGN